MAGLEALAPDVPLSPAQRLAREMTEVYQRITDLERSRSRATFGAYDPASSPTPPYGAFHINTATNRAFVWTGAEWVSADAVRGQQTLAPQVTSTSTTSQDLGGPNVTVTVPANGIIMAYADVEIWGNPGAGAATAAGAVDLRDSVGGGLSTVAANNAAGWVRSTPINQVHPRGSWIFFMPGAGVHTFSLWYRRAIGTTADAFFRNRTLRVVVL